MYHIQLNISVRLNFVPVTLRRDGVPFSVKLLKPVIELLPSILLKTKRINSATELPASFWNRKTYYCALMKTDGRRSATTTTRQRRDVLSYTPIGLKNATFLLPPSNLNKWTACYDVMKKHGRVDIGSRRRLKKQSTNRPPGLFYGVSGSDSHSGPVPRPQFILSINNISAEKQELIPCVILYNFIVSDV